MTAFYLSAAKIAPYSSTPLMVRHGNATAAHIIGYLLPFSRREGYILQYYLIALNIGQYSQKTVGKIFVRPFA